MSTKEVVLPRGMIALSLGNQPIYVRAMDVDVIQPLLVMSDGEYKSGGTTQIAVRGVVINVSQSPAEVARLIVEVEDALDQELADHLAGE
jgi:hypothetical protein